MGVHDWTKVDAGIFHDFHNVWIAELRNLLNGGMLPAGYYAMSEQHAGRYIADILTLQTDVPRVQSGVEFGGVAVADAPPKVSRKLSLSATARTRQKTLTIRHSSGHRIVALLEIISAANKDRREHVEEFLNKAEEALNHGIHLMLVDLFPPGKYDPCGMHGALWQRLGDAAEEVLQDEPLTLSSYVADSPITAYLERTAPGRILPEMPLFLDPDHYVNVPLEATYQSTWRGTPEPWRQLLERVS